MASQLAKDIVAAALEDDVLSIQEAVDQALTERAQTLVEGRKADFGGKVLKDEVEESDPEEEDDFDDQWFEDDDDEEDLNEATYRFDIASDHDLKGALSDFHKGAKAHGLKSKTHTMKGPGGGWPVAHVTGDSKAVHKFVKKHYDDSMSHNDLSHHKINEEDETSELTDDDLLYLAKMSDEELAQVFAESELTDEEQDELLARIDGLKDDSDEE